MGQGGAAVVGDIVVEIDVVHARHQGCAWAGAIVVEVVAAIQDIKHAAVRAGAVGYNARREGYFTEEGIDTIGVARQRAVVQSGFIRTSTTNICRVAGEDAVCEHPSQGVYPTASPVPLNY